MNIGEILLDLWQGSGFNAIFSGFLAESGWQNLVMIAIACVLLYLGIVKKFEPLLMVGIAFGCLLTNLPLWPLPPPWPLPLPPLPVRQSPLPCPAPF